jgi:hypothetical protein
MAILSYQGDELLKEVWVGHKTMVERPSLLSLKINNKLTRSWPLNWRGCFGQGRKWDAPSSFGLWAWLLEASRYFHPSRKAVEVHGQMFELLGSAFGGFTLCLTEGSNSHISLVIFNPFLWTLNEVWSFNPMASRLERP